MKQKSPNPIVFTSEQREEIIKNYFFEGMSYVKLAEKFKTTNYAIKNITAQHMIKLLEAGYKKRTEWQHGM